MMQPSLMSQVPLHDSIGPYLFVIVSVSGEKMERHALIVKVESNRRLISNGDSNGTKKSKTSSNRLNNSQEIITYSDVAFAAWGDIGRFVIDGSLICAQVGFCCGYLIFITENLSNYFTSVNKTSWLVFLLPPLFFLTLIPDLRKLAIFSLMAQVSNLMAFAVVYWFDFEHLHLASAANRKEISLKGFPFFFCAAVLTDIICLSFYFLCIHSSCFWS